MNRADTANASANDTKVSGQREPDRTVVHCTRLNYWFGQAEQKTQVLFDVNFDIAPGEMVMLTGPSGSGKTTLLQICGAILPVREGSVQVAGRELAGLNDRELAVVRRQIGFIPPNSWLISSLTIEENVRLGLSGFTSKETRQIAAEALAAAGLGNRLHYRPHHLSGGQRPVGIARALAGRPQLIVAEEPTAALDQHSGRDVVNLLRQLTKQHGSSVLMVTPDNRILDVADRIVDMCDGRIKSDVLVSARTND